MHSVINSYGCDGDSRIVSLKIICGDRLLLFYLDVIFHVLILMLCVIQCQRVVLDKLCQSLIAASCAF